MFSNFLKSKSVDILDSATSPSADSPLTDAPEAAPGADTSTMHFSIKSKLGWVAWKEKESSLYRYLYSFSLLERAFSATRCELKISDMLNEFAMEVEIPNDQVVNYFHTGKIFQIF